MIIDEFKKIRESKAYYDYEVEILGVDLFPRKNSVDAIPEPILISLSSENDISSIEIFTKKETWKDEDIKEPKENKIGNIIFEEDDFNRLDNEKLSVPKYNPKERLVHLPFEGKEILFNIKVAENLIIEISSDKLIAGLWITKIEFYNSKK